MGWAATRMDAPRQRQHAASLALAAACALACLPAHAGGRNSVRVVIGGPVLLAPGFGAPVGGTVIGGTVVGGQVVPAPQIQGYTPGSIYFGSSGSYTVVPMNRGARVPLHASPLYAVPVPVFVPAPAPAPAQAASPAQLRYYCPDWNDYWPEVQSCPSAWLKVVP